MATLNELEEHIRRLEARLLALQEEDTQTVNKLIKRHNLKFNLPPNLLEQLNQFKKISADFEFLKRMPKQYVYEILHGLQESKSQLRQDLFVLSELGFRKGGFFVEFGATNGVDLSNSFLLENKYGWKGILAEPGKGWHIALKQNRKCQIDYDCVWSMTGQVLEFYETDIAELSTLDLFSNKEDFNIAGRKKGTRYPVHTISLNDLLKKYNAPKHIDYLSIDTEGSELEILSAFDFDEYSFSVITCEHNFTSDREKIYDLLTKRGFQRKYQELSSFDDWYVKAQ